MGYSCNKCIGFLRWFLAAYACKMIGDFTFLMFSTPGWAFLWVIILTLVHGNSSHSLDKVEMIYQVGFPYKMNYRSFDMHAASNGSVLVWRDV